MLETISVQLVLYLFLAHLIGDFFLQSDTLAVNKSSNNAILFVHVLIYIGVFASGLMFAGMSYPTEGLIPFLAANFVGHFCTDYVSSRVAKYYWTQDKRHEFFVTIGVDQFIHMTTLVVTASLFLRITGIQ